MTWTGWSRGNLFANADTMASHGRRGHYLHARSDGFLRHRFAAEDADGPLLLLPYPVVTVDMEQNLARMKSPTEIEALWLDYVVELADEARGDPAREATTVVIGIHPFVIGTPRRHRAEERS